MSKDNQELRKLIEENPELPLVFCVSNDNLYYDDYSMTVFEGCYCKVEEIYTDEERYYNDSDEILDDYKDKLCDNEEYKDLSDDEFEEAVEKYIDENIRHYKAIVIYVG